MSKAKGFLKYRRANPQYQPVEKRVRHFKEFEKTLDDEATHDQAARCMDCGIPFCHGETGCPTDNLIPEFNDLIYNGHWKEALENLHSTNNFPEFTGRLCPAPCETACVLGITDPPVTIKAIERSIIDHGFEEGWVEPMPAQELTGKSVAIVGSGPAGLACAQQLARAGHNVTVFERADKVGGLLRYGIPDFKMEKWHIDRRIDQMAQEGVVFRTNVNVGVDITASELMETFDALVLAIGAEDPIPLKIPGNDLKGVEWAMDYLVQANRVTAGEEIRDQILATDKHVIVIGGGDTGSDCIGTANRQEARSIINFRRSPRPPDTRPPDQPWPLYPDVYYTSTSHEEGVDRRFNIKPLEVLGNQDGQCTHLRVVQVEKGEDGRFKDIAGTEESWPADLILLAMGYRGPIRPGLMEELVQMGLELDKWGNIKAEFGTDPGCYRTNLEGVYTCGDARRGQSLIVWAISEGRKCAAEIHRELLAGNRQVMATGRARV
ncbi:MAG: glutamate synthase subunit beta [Spirochaetales bacterium]|nr:glutamate synthase subunit beta [Leptospiraceae bacterium]MCP5480393.1 glutamate synthase subunit beta [Spirochaetales bacterium]